MIINTDTGPVCLDANASVVFTCVYVFVKVFSV